MSIIVIMFIQNHFGEVQYVKSTVDNRAYLVRKLPNNQKAANYLANVNAKLTHLVKHMMAKYPGNQDVLQLYNNYNPNAISEGSYESGYTSYTVNKGEKLILCIRQKDQSFVDENTILYIAIHELAHIMTLEVGHTAKFWDNFRLLLKEAIDIKMYYKVDFHKAPQDYCGIKITSSII